MSLIEIFSILIIHWFADFVLQTEKEAVNKSNSFKYLISHTLSYSIVWLVIGNFYVLISAFNGIIISPFPLNVLIFWGVTLISHTITYYFTSRLNKKLVPKSVHLEFVSSPQEGTFYPKGSKWHNFFVGIGFDQLLHYFQLFITYYLLK